MSVEFRQTMLTEMMRVIRGRRRRATAMPSPANVWYDALEQLVEGHVRIEC